MARLLVVDDDPLIRETIVSILQAAGHDVLCAEDGRRALRLLIEHEVDILLTDLIMPEMDGIEMIREVRRRLPGLKILAMSGGFRNHAVNYDALGVAKALGANQVLRKPFGSAELIALVDGCLGA